MPDKVVSSAIWAGHDPDLDYLVWFSIDEMSALILGHPLPNFDPPAGYWERSLRTAIHVRGIRFRFRWWRYEMRARIRLARTALLGRHECE